MKKKSVLILASLACAAAVYLSANSQKTSALDLIKQNVEALTQDEILPGKTCRYSGSSTYGDYIPCTASYPNIGKCGSRENGYYSTDTGQCYE